MAHNPSRYPLLVRFQSFFGVSHSLIKELENYIDGGVPQLYQNIIDGKNHVMTDSNFVDELKLYGYLAIIGTYYGFDSKEYLNIKDNLFDYAIVDPGWIECFTNYLEDHTINYIPPINMMDSVYKIKEEFSAVMLGDWATGSPNAIYLIKEVAKINPDYFIHLGDTYYAGTIDEQNMNFASIVEKYIPNTRVFAVPGNHDYYSGSKGFDWLLKQIGQSNSYFILENDHIQIHGINAAIKNYNPFKSDANSEINDIEAKWHIDHVLQSNKKIIFSDHFPFIAYNDYIAGENIDIDMYRQFKSVINKVDGWYWGHIHKYQMYEPYEFIGGEILKKGRLIGMGSCEIEDSIPDSYKPFKYSGKYKDCKLIPGNWHSQTNEETIANGFMLLEGKYVDNEYKITTKYYQIPTPKVGQFEPMVKCYEEEI